MKKLVFIVLLLALVWANQTPKCSICLKVAKCQQDLYQDTYVDPIYNFIVKQVQPKDVPIEIRKESTKTQARYTFIWAQKKYLADVDLETNKFKIMEVQSSNEVMESQKKLGMRSESDQAPVSTSSSTSDIVKFIDNDIRTKHFAAEKVDIVSSKQTDKGFYLVYQRQNGQKLGFDVVVETQGGNMMINYKIYNENSKTTSSQAQQQGPSLAAYQVISDPLKNSDVLTALSFLTQKVNSIIQYATLVKAECQTGFYLRLTISFDTASSTVYVVVLYRNSGGVYSIISMNMAGEPQNYSFNQSLTNEQFTKSPFISSILQLLRESQKPLQTPATQVTAIFMFYPYFKITYKNQKFSRLEYIVRFQIFSKNLTIIGSSGVGYPATAPSPSVAVAPVAQSTSQTHQKITPQPSQTISQQASQVTTQQTSQPIQTVTTHLSTQQQTTTQQSTSSQPKHSHADGFEPISAELSQQAFVNNYIDYIIAESGLSRSSLIGVFCHSENPSFLSFRFRLSNGQVKEYNGSADYIQYKLRTSQAMSSIRPIPNCLQQNQQVCLKCAYHYYLSGGACYQVPDECNEFDYVRNVCNTCYHGYYLDWNNICQEAHFLCQTSDRRGFCLTCYKNYRLTSSGRCVFNAKGCDYSPAQEENALCSFFKGLQCQACVQGCYLDPKGQCKLPDPNCDSFDTVNEKCRVCLDGYYLSSNGKKCVREADY